MNFKKASQIVKTIKEGWNDDDTHKFWNTPRGHFTFGGGSGELEHDYHIQHVVSNPEEHGFDHIDHALEERKKEVNTLQAHIRPQRRSQIKNKKQYLADINDGIMDIDHHLETAAMKRGSVRGYDMTSDGGREIFMDAAHHTHAIRTLKHFLPSLEATEKAGNPISVSYSVYELGKGAGLGHHIHPDFADSSFKIKLQKGQKPRVRLNSTAQIRQHIRELEGGSDPAKTTQFAPKEDQSKAPTGFGRSQESTPEKVKLQKTLQAQGMPRFKAAAQAGFSEAYSIKEKLKKKLRENK